MITGLQDKQTSIYTISYGVNRVQVKQDLYFRPADVGNADYVFNSVAINFEGAGYSFIDFIAMKSETKPSGTLAAYGDYFNNQTSATIVTGRDSTRSVSFNATAWGIDSRDAAVTAPTNRIVEIYNSLYGGNHTGAEVLAALQSLYGEEYKSFCVSVNAANSTSTTPSKEGRYYFRFPASMYNSNYTTTWDNMDDIEGGKSYAGYVDTYEYGNVDANKLPFQGRNYQIDTDICNTCWKLAAYLIFEENPLDEKLIFDVYVDGVIGEKGPSFQIKWRNNSDQSALPMNMIRANVSGWGYMGALEDPTLYITDEGGINVPAGGELIPFHNEYPFDSEGFSSNYVYVSNDWYENKSMLDRVTAFGFDMIPEHIGFFLRFDQSDGQGNYTWGDLWYVTIPYEYEGAAYIQHAPIANSRNNPNYATEVNIIGGIPADEPEDDPDETEPGYDDDDDESGDGPYPDPGDQPDISDYDSEGFPGNSILTKTYKLTSARLQDVGTKLWSQSYFDVLKVQSNPIENIIACRWYPMDITGGSDEGIVIGDISIGTNGSPIPTTYKKTIGSYTYKGVISENGKNLSPGYLAQSPYTIIKLHLPYVGTVQLDASEIYNRQLHVEYIVDIITGDVLVLLKLGSKKLPYMSLSGKMGVDIPISGTDRAQIQIANATRAMTAAIGAAGHMIAGDAGGAIGSASGILSMAGMDYSTQRVIQHSSVCASYDNRAIVLEMQVNKTYVSAGYAKYHGLPSHQYTKLTKGMGFIQVSRRTIIDVAMTDEENRMLEAIMTQGCYF